MPILICMPYAPLFGLSKDNIIVCTARSTNTNGYLLIFSGLHEYMF